MESKIKPAIPSKGRKAYAPISVIDEGTFGKVICAKHLASGMEVAIKNVKILDGDQYSHRHLLHVCRELYIL